MHGMLRGEKYRGGLHGLRGVAWGGMRVAPWCWESGLTVRALCNRGALRTLQTIKRPFATGMARIYPASCLHRSALAYFTNRMM